MARQIACGHCGQTHASVAEVRICANVDTVEGPPTAPRPSPPPPNPAPPAQAGPVHTGPVHADPIQAGPARTGPTRAAPARVWTAEALAGPDALGRSLLIDADDPAPVGPGPWRDAPVIEADATAGPDLVDRLHQAWRERQRLVIRWRGPLPDPDPVVDISPGGTPFWALGPGMELPGERLRFAVTANTVDARRPEARFEPMELALALGDRSAMPLVDGGPLDPLDGVGEVVPRHHLLAGVLRPHHPDPPAPSAQLAPDQLAAVAHRGGPARIIAPAGSGKTRVLTERTRHLVVDRGLHPAAVSLVAYNRRARTEMAERLADVPGLEIRTLNSLALALATGRRGSSRSTAASRGVTTITELDARRLLERIVPGKRRRQLSDPLEPWVDALSACRLGLRDPDEVESAYGADIAGFPEVLDRYRAELRRTGAVDFDEQILAAIEVLLADPEARRQARRATPILLVDEFQDLTPAHLLLVRLLAGPAGEVYAVGDDDQTIYGYTGASPEWLVDFASYFPGAADHRLTVNYRCPPAVVEAAANLLTHNHYRVAKSIEPAPHRAPADGALRINAEHDPQAALTARVAELLSNGAAPGEIAVLARVNAALMPAAIHLTMAGHPVERPPGLDSRLLERSGMAAALAWLRLAAGPGDLAAEDLRLALRRPPRSLHPRIADWVCEQRSVERLVALADRLTSERDAATVQALASDLARLQRRAARGATTAQLLDLVYDEIGLLRAVSQLDQSQRSARRAAHADELRALRAVADLAPGPVEFERWLRRQLDDPDSQRAPAGNGEGNGNNGGDRIVLATIHATKGLEWPHVIVHDVRDDLYPHRLSNDREEERRVFHVAVTRGRDTVLVNVGPPGPDRTPSPFVAELASARPHDAAAAPVGVIRSSGAPPTGRAPSAARGGSGDGTATGTSRSAPGGDRSRNQTSSDKTSRGERAERREPADEAEAARRQALTTWRTARCRADGMPAYIVLDNATLDAIAAANPSDLAALGRVKGIGPTKLDRYGADILGVLADAAP